MAPRTCCVVIASVFFASSVAYVQNRPGYELLGRATVPLDGRKVSFPLPRGGHARDFLIRIESTLQCSIEGWRPGRLHSEDSVIRLMPEKGVGSPGGITHYRADGTLAYVECNPPVYYRGGGPFRHSPITPVLPDHVGAYIDVDRLARDLGITPSRARDSLTGEVTIAVYRRLPDTNPPLPLGGMVILGVGALCVGLLIRLWARRKGPRARGVP